MDDPFTFGQVAVANALSDVYAMGGTSLTGMNLVAFPIKTLSPAILKEILLGGLSKSEWMKTFGAHACTDITGFSFIGHALEKATDRNPFPFFA